MRWKKLQPNEHGDWIKQRNEAFETFIPLKPKKPFVPKNESFFDSSSSGLATSRDAWCYNFSKKEVTENIKRSLSFFNQQSLAFQKAKQANPNLKVENFIDLDPTKISWDRQQRKDVETGKLYEFTPSSLNKGLYRPFHKQWVYFNRQFNNCVYQLPKLFPTPSQSNLVILTTGKGDSKDFSCLISEFLPCYDTIGKTQVFPLYYYEEREKQAPTLFEESGDNQYIRRDGVSDWILQRARQQYGAQNIQKEDIFYYVYGFLHSPDYRTAFANDLKKMLPRIPLVEDVRDFWAFSKAGRALAELHLNYENVPPYEGVIVNGDNPQPNEDLYRFYRVEKMKFAKKSVEIDGKKKKIDDKSTIIYNSRITISNIPEKAYEYVVNGKSAIEWIMERYQVKTDKKSGITNDPNDWSLEHEKPRYILDLLLSIINVSMQTLDIVGSLPKLNFEE
jgi:predicted helicase